MQTSKQYRHNAQVCLKLASETTPIYAKMALIDRLGTREVTHRFSPRDQPGAVVL
jgi:hypothetical protein